MVGGFVSAVIVILFIVIILIVIIILIKNIRKGNTKLSIILFFIYILIHFPDLDKNAAR